MTITKNQTFTGINRTRITNLSFSETGEVVAILYSLKDVPMTNLQPEPGMEFTADEVRQILTLMEKEVKEVQADQCCTQSSASEIPAPAL